MNEKLLTGSQLRLPLFLSLWEHRRLPPADSKARRCVETRSLRGCTSRRLSN